MRCERPEDTLITYSSVCTSVPASSHELGTTDVFRTSGALTTDALFLKRASLTSQTIGELVFHPKYPNITQ